MAFRVCSWAEVCNHTSDPSSHHSPHLLILVATFLVKAMEKWFTYLVHYSCIAHEKSMFSHITIQGAEWRKITSISLCTRMEFIFLQTSRSRSYSLQGYKLLRSTFSRFPFPSWINNVHSNDLFSSSKNCN